MRKWKKLYKVFDMRLVVILLVIIGGGGITWKLYNKIERLEAAYVAHRDAAPSANSVDLLFQLYAMDKASDHFDNQEHHVLCLGNSLTKHERVDSIGWKSDWGMAASSESKDYCHQLESLLRDYNAKSTVTPLSIKVWEKDLTTDIDSLLSQHIVGKDIVIIRLGENVVDNNLFNEAICKLVSYCQKKVSKVYITGLFWQNDERESAIINAAKKYRVKYIPLFWLPNLYSKEIYPKECDTLIDTEGNPYKIKGHFIITHPNDLGMRIIAETIFHNL